MRDITNLMTGLVAVMFGVAMMLWIVPAQTVPAIFASVPSGFYPNFTSGMLVVSGLALGVSGFIKAADASSSLPKGFAIRLTFAFVLLVGAMYLVPVIGFLPAGILICVTVLILMGERRWPIIAAICLIAPVAVWGAFELLMGRPLP